MTCDLGRADKNPSITCSCLSLSKASLQVLGGLWEQERRPSLTTCVSDPWRAFGGWVRVWALTIPVSSPPRQMGAWEEVFPPDVTQGSGDSLTFVLGVGGTWGWAGGLWPLVGH